MNDVINDEMLLDSDMISPSLLILTEVFLSYQCDPDLSLMCHGPGPCSPLYIHGSGEPTMVEHFRILKRSLGEINNHFDIIYSYFEKLAKEKTNSSKRLDVVLHQVQQLRLTAEEDTEQDMEARARSEDAAVDEKFGDIWCRGG